MTAEPPKRWFIPTTYSEVFGRRPTRDNLATFVRALPWEDLVPKLSAIALLSWQRGVEDPKHQQDLVTNLLAFKPTYIAKLQALLTQKTPPHILITRETLLALLRVAVVEQSNSIPDSEASFSDNLVRAALAANEFISGELPPDNPKVAAVDLIATELRSAVMHLENPHVLLGRTDAFFKWSATDKAKAHPDYLPIETDLKRFTGLTHLEFAAGAYAVLSRTVAAKTLDEIKNTGVFFDPEAWLAQISQQRALRAWLEQSTISIQDICEEWRNEKSLSYAGAGSLYRKPIIAIDKLSFAPTPDLLTNAMGDGTYFALFDNYSEEHKGQLGGLRGAWFEDYTASIFERGYAHRSGTIVRREFEYRPGEKSSDVVVLENGDIMFIEVVAKRMNLVRSILRLDPATIEKDLRAGVMHKFEQLQRNIDHFRSGVLFPDLPRSANQRLFPVLVSPKAFPRIYLLGHLLKAAMDQQGLFKDVEPPELLTIDEVEQLESDLAKGLELTPLLVRKNRSTPQRRFMTLNNYLIDEEPKISTGPDLALERGSIVAKDLIALTTAWFS